ncbi:MAG TPA: hypothetical protein ENN74_04065 [Firmicutes bacterium]|nr:hypothetical protein [Bacillota bacterium]
MRTRTYFSWFPGAATGILILLGGNAARAETEPEADVYSPAIHASSEQVSPATSGTVETVEAKAGDEGIRLNFRGASLDSVLDYLSKAAGFVIVRELEIEGRVDVWSHQPLTEEEAADLLNTILNEKGYTAIRSGRTLTIVRRDEARTRDLPVRIGADPDRIPKTDEMVTQIIPVRYADAVQLTENLRLLIPSYATLTSNESSNALVLTDTQANVRRMVEIIQALDTSISSISEFKVFPLKYSDATELAQVINKIFEAQQTGTGGRDSRAARMERFFTRMRGGPEAPSDSATGDSVARQAASRVVAVADERTNSLVVSAPAELMATIEQLVSEVDTVAEDITEVRVFPLRFADAETMAEIITSVFQEESQSTQPQTRRFFRGGPSGQPAQQEQTSRRNLQQSKVLAVADTRTNSVVVSAAKELMNPIERMVQDLDANPAKEKRVFVYSLENADVESVAEILRGMFEETSGRSTGTTERSDRLRQSVGTQQTTTGGTTRTQRR